MKAQELFSSVTKGEISNYPVHMLCLIHLTELLLDELNQYGEEVVFDEITT